MKVEKVIVKTIKRSTDRRAAVKACLLDSDVPECLIEFYYGIDAKCAKKDSAMGNLVIGELEKCGLHFHESENITWPHVCSSLSFYQALMKISQSDKTTMLMNDDKKLIIPFYEFQVLLSELPSDVKVFQPQWYLHPDEMDHFNYIEVRFPEGIQYPSFVHGFLAYGDDVLVFTPEGAAWACEQIRAESACYKAGHCILRGKSDGLYTSKDQLTAEIGGQGYWKSDHGEH